MTTFLGRVAGTMWRKYAGGVSDFSFIFPSRRARLFFAEKLSCLLDGPIWQPGAVTIDQLVEEMSGLRGGDRIRLVVELYKVYSRYHDEPFDSFFFWGEMLLADFDSVDKYLLDADDLFSNIADLKELERDMGYLSEEQRAVVARFWGSFGHAGDHSAEQAKFMAIWNTLAPVYHEFRAVLAERGMAYGGMAYRAAAERIKAGVRLEGVRKFAVVGFNALSECEKVIFDYLAREHEVEFFWDYDRYYVDDREQEAGLFLRENIKRFPSRTPLEDDFRNFAGPKNITVVSAPSDSLQCKYVSDFLRRHSGAGKETAIVLTDENLLTPVLHAIPPEVRAINVTMGYPLRQTLEYAFVERLIGLQARRRERGGVSVFYHEDVVGLLGHPFVGEHALAAQVAGRQQIYVAMGEREDIFCAVDGWTGLAAWLRACVLRSGGRAGFVGTIVENIEKLTNSLTDCDVELSAATFASLLRRVLQSGRVPYEGEPLEGVQVMGILETRNLDFENVLLLSAADDTFPGNRANQPSFIPYNLRMAYGLPTPQHHEGVYAYYFYRLLQRASNVDIAYSARSDERSSGEQSRYIYQLEYESPHAVARRELSIDVSVEPCRPITVAKTPEILEKMRRKPLSPSAFINFVQCPLKFYFHTVAEVRATDGVDEEVGAPMFGTILHKAMDLIHSGSYEPGRAVDSAILQEYYGDDEASAADRSGALLLAREIVLKYIEGSILPFDKRVGAVVEGTEKQLEAEVAGVRFAGVADRVDNLPDGRARVIDYKTGAPNLEFKGVRALFSDDPGDRNHAALQTFLYAMMLVRATGRDAQPALYYVRAMRDPDYSPLLVDRLTGALVESYADYRAEFETLLAERVADLFDPGKPFVQAADNTPCAMCDFNPVCRR